MALSEGQKDRQTLHGTASVLLGEDILQGHTNPFL